MCGIVAVIGDPDQNRAEQAARRMLSAIRRRGPDGQGVTSSGSVVLGHCLLRVLLCPKSKQPMLSKDGRCSIAFNGQIYDFRRVRQVLIEEGATFYTDTDTEVLMELYRRRGPSFVNSLDGMVAFVLHDRERAEVLVYRDYLGQKPLYLCHTHDRVLLSSSLTSFYSVLGSGPIDHDTLHDYLWTLQTPGDRTFMATSRQVGPGELLIFREDGSIAKRHQNPRPAFAPSAQRIDLITASKEFEWRLSKSIQMVTAGVKNPAFHLSGGLDSSTLVAHAITVCDAPIKTYSCSYSDTSDLCASEKGFEEAHYAALVAKCLGVENFQIHVTPDIYELTIDEVIQAIGEPRGNPCIPHYLLAQRISHDHRVCISGEGADELLGGYPWKLECAQFGNPDDIEQALFNRFTSADSEILAGCFAKPWADKRLPFLRFCDTLAVATYENPLDAVMTYDLQVFLRYLLGQADSLSSYHAVEGRYPFLQHDVLSFLTQLPPELRYSDRNAAKPVLRAHASHRLPQAVLTRPKVGFSAPEGTWYRGALSQWLTNTLLNKNSRILPLFRPGGLQRLLHIHRSRQANFRKLLWGMMSLETWMQHLDLYVE